MKNGFYIPRIDTLNTEQVIKKSRFIANLKKVYTKNEATAFISSIKEKYKDAGHNCWAFLIGPPSSPIAIGYSDDGEPKGTAGTPILNVIQQKNVSMTVVVITRYFGGVKLGASGLIRAYSGTANIALVKAELVKFEKKLKIEIKTTYSFINNVLNILTQNNISILESEYLDKIVLTIEVNDSQKNFISSLILDTTKGEAIITLI